MRSLYLLLLALPLAFQTHAVDRWVVRDGALQAENRDGGTLCEAASVSVTIPPTAGVLAADPTTNYCWCVENTADPVCTTSAPTSTVSQTAWVCQANQRRLGAVTNTQTLRPNRVWLQNKVAGQCLFYHWRSAE